LRVRGTEEPQTYALTNIHQRRSGYAERRWPERTWRTFARPSLALECRASVRGGIPYARSAGDHPEDICHRAGQRTRWHIANVALTIRFRAALGFHGFGGLSDLSGETVRTLADQTAAERTNEGQRLCFGA